jgi:outer membrane murein-binding lipoprotein Lpp
MGDIVYRFDGQRCPRCDARSITDGKGRWCESDGCGWPTWDRAEDDGRAVQPADGTPPPADVELLALANRTLTTQLEDARRALTDWDRDLTDGLDAAIHSMGYALEAAHNEVASLHNEVEDLRAQVEALTADVEALRARAEDEAANGHWMVGKQRAAIVAWLRLGGPDQPTLDACEAADAIERGDHIRGDGG